MPQWQLNSDEVCPTQNMIVVAYVCTYQADELRQGHPHSDHHLLLPVTSRPDLHVVVIKDLLVEPPFYF